MIEPVDVQYITMITSKANRFARVLSVSTLRMKLKALLSSITWAELRKKQLAGSLCPKELNYLWESRVPNERYSMRQRNCPLVIIKRLSG